MRSCKTVLRRSGSSWWVMCEFGLDVFGYTPTQTTLAHPSPPGAARPFGGCCVRHRYARLTAQPPKGRATQG